MIHGHPDPLSSAIWSLGTLYDSLPDSRHYFKEKIRNILSPIYSDSTCYDMLCEDPLSINILGASSGGEKIKRMVYNSLADNPKILNSAFNTFLQIARVQQTPLAELLTTMRPCNPRVCNAIVSSTLIGRAWKVVKKVIKTPTLIGVMLDARFGQTMFLELDGEFLTAPESNDFPRMSHNFEKNYYLGVTNQIFGYRAEMDLIDPTGLCSVLHAQKLRDES